MKIKNIIFNRNMAKFKDSFGVHPRFVISRMDKNKDDIPDQVPIHQIKIDKIGVIRENIPLRVLDPFFMKENICLYSRIEIFTEISAKKRGLHMSRIGDVVAMVSQDDFKFTEDFIKKIAIKVSKSQYDNGAFVKLTAPFSFYEDVLCEGKKNKQSLENINLVYSVKYKNNKFIFESGLEFNNITACPCVQQTFKHALLESGIKKNEFNKLVPFLTHSQRCRTKVLIKGYRDYLNILEVLKIIDKSTLRVQNTLPRDHELNIVHKAHKNPQFTEDIVRGVAFNIYKKLNDKNPQASVSVEIDSMESIHDFNIQAKVDYSFKDLKKYESAL